MKYCPKCETNKSLSDFSKSRCKKDGLQCYCKACQLIAQVAYRKTQAGKETGRRHSQTDTCKETSRRYNQTDARKESHREGSKVQRLNYPDKAKAHDAVSNAIRDGKLERPSHCESCFQEKFVHGHHEDYNKPLDVDWLCIKCHFELHRKLQLV